MIRILLGVEELAGTRFAISPLGETVHSLRALADPGSYTLHLPWLRAVRQQLDPRDLELLLALVGRPRIPTDYRGTPSTALPDFLTPPPTRFLPGFDEELALIRTTAPRIVRRDVVATHAPDPVPAPLGAIGAGDARTTRRRLDAIADALQRYWDLAISPIWRDLRLVLEADTTYRARELATGGAQRLFADIHPNVSWADGVLTVTEMIGHHTVAAGGRGLLLMPSIFAAKPVPPLDPTEPPALTYPSRGIGTLWTRPSRPEPAALVDLLGRTRAGLLLMLEEPLSTAEVARRLDVTASAVSQHLQVLHAAGLVTRDRAGRQVLYRRSPVGDQLMLGE